MLNENEVKCSVEVACSKHEMLEILQKLRTPGLVKQNIIYILTNEVDRFHALGRDPQIQILTTHGICNQIKALLAKENSFEKAFRQMQLSPTEMKDYMKKINDGGMVIISGADPFNESEWTGHTLTKWITDDKNSSNLANRGVREGQPVRYKPPRKAIHCKGI